MADANQFNQLKMDTLRIEIEYERLDRKVDRLQNDITSVQNDLRTLRSEVHAGFESLERMLLKALDRRDRDTQGDQKLESSNLLQGLHL